MTQKQLAQAAAVDEGELGKYLKAETIPTGRTIAKLAMALNVSYARLLADENERALLDQRQSPQIPSWQSALSEALKPVTERLAAVETKVDREPQPKGAAGEILELLSGLPESDAVAVSGVVRKMVERAKSQTKKRSDTG